MPFVGKWMELENILLSKLSQTQKVQCSLSYVEARGISRKEKVEQPGKGRGDGGGEVLGIEIDYIMCLCKYATKPNILHNYYALIILFLKDGF